MIGTGALLGDDASGTSLEFTVLNDRKTDPPPIELGVIGSDSPINGSWVIGIG